MKMKNTRPQYRKMYSTARWKSLRKIVLARAPVCAICERAGSEIVDHIIPHKGDLVLFYQQENLQGLCKRCHDREKQLLERGVIIPKTGVDGWPVQESKKSICKNLKGRGE